MKKTTLFTQLIYNVVIPVVIALMVLAFLNYENSRILLQKSYEKENNIITDEISQILEFQDMSLGILEDNLDKKIHYYSSTISNIIFKNTDNIEKVNLNKIRKYLEMNPDYEDIYIINSQGIVVNTTFKKDLNLNFFNFGEKHKQHLLSVFKEKKYVSERFAIESSTKRLKKYTYQPTINGKYIVEIGVYSEKADGIISFVKDKLNNIANRQENILSVDLFIGADHPFSLNKDANPNDIYYDTLLKVFKDRKTRKFVITENDKKIQYEYLYMKRKNTGLYEGSVIRIISDHTQEGQLMQKELIKSAVVFGFIFLFLFIIIWYNARKLTKPIENLVESVNHIANGDFNYRSKIVGTNEISELSVHFNKMVTQIENYYHELEAANKRLEELNKTLEKRIESEVNRNRKKDLILSKQNHQVVVGELIGNIAHHWRQPLNAVAIIIQNLKEAHEFGELNDEYLTDKVSKAMELIKHMSKTISDFSFFFISDKEKQEFSVKENIEKTIAFIEESFHSNNININLVVEKDSIIEGYPNEYSQVIINILNNSRDEFVLRKIANPKILITINNVSGRSVVDIQDNAGGINIDAIDKIFEPYFTTKQSGEGTGLGLYISRVLIEKNMKGKISAMNVIGGAKFKVEA